MDNFSLYQASLLISLVGVLVMVGMPPLVRRAVKVSGRPDDDNLRSTVKSIRIVGGLLLVFGLFAPLVEMIFKK